MSDNMVTLNDRSTITVEQFLASRRAEGLKIDPATAKVHWTWAYVPDPYGIFTLDQVCWTDVLRDFSGERHGLVW
jgi:hypothetical protein